MEDTEKTYYVHVPVTMDVLVELKAKSREEALKVAIDRLMSATFQIDESEIVKKCEKIKTINIEENESHDIVTVGNVYNGVLNEAYTDP
jgi:SHS2 domain-containing protein